MTDELSMLADAIRQQTEYMKMRDKSLDLYTKAPASGPTYTELHGAGSLFGSNPIERDVISAHMRPSGLGAVLGAYPSVFEHPIFSTLTGYTATNGAEAVNPCDDAPAGYVKSCDITAQFGRIMRDTQTIEIDKVMRRANRGDFMDLRLRGEVFGNVGLSSGLTKDQILSVVTKSEMVIAGVNMERTLSTLLWQGTPANNTAGGGYMEFPGLDSQIATGHKDYSTGQLCPALDSDVKNFNYNPVDGNSPSIVDYMSMLEYYLTNNAEGMGLNPVQWVWVMRPQLWHELTEVWPCQYNTNRCASTMSDSNATVAVMGNEMIAQRDQMRRSMTIDVNGTNYRVVTDTGIYEYNSTNDANLLPGRYASNIYFVPLSITGGFPVTYWEHMDYRGAGDDIALLNNKANFWTDDGRYFWAYEGPNFCFKLKMKIEPRVVLRTPQLAGRIDLVRYEPLQHVREPDPDSPYFYDGGVSMRPDPSFYSIWS